MEKPKISMSRRTWKSLKIAAWVAFVVVGGLIFYVNHYAPKGQMYPTGGIVCENDSRGKCIDEYKEDLRNVDMPEWQKFFKNDALLLLGVLLVLGLVLSNEDIRNDHIKKG